MSIEIKVPMLPESVADATIVTWHKKVGDTVKRDENIVDLETDKVVLEVPAPEDGVLGDILKKEGTVVKAGEILATLVKDTSAVKSEKNSSSTAEVEDLAAPKRTESSKSSAGPAARRTAAEKGIALEDIQGSGKSGRITREDVFKQTKSSSSLASSTKQSVEPKSAPSSMVEESDSSGRIEKRVPMTRLRSIIAKRLVEVQQTAAILTTFNEVNLQKVIELRVKYKDLFDKKYGIRLGFMSFFTKAVIEALKRYPAVNASIDGNDMIYRNYADIGIAVSSERGLVVPVIRDADKLSFADIEKSISNFARKAKENQITIEDMTGGTFTITNGGVFGSLLNMPIINPPQSAILGMNNIQDRPVAENGQVVIRPMMYIALSYDHRIIDGKESVGFLKVIKELLEEPARLLLNV